MEIRHHALRVRVRFSLDEAARGEIEDWDIAALKAELAGDTSD